MHLKAHPIKLCKTGNIRSNFQKLGTFGNLKVLPFQNHHFLLDQAIYVDFILILVKETMIFECKIPPCIFRPIWPKIKISIKVIKYRYSCGQKGLTVHRTIVVKLPLLRAV